MRFSSLMKLTLAGSIAALLTIVPPLTNFPAQFVLADDDDDDAGDDDDDDARPVRRAAPAPVPDYVPDEILLINASEAVIQRASELGFRVYSTEIFAASQLTVARLRLPAGMDAPTALALLRREVPQQISELNHLYRLQQEASRSAPNAGYDCGSSRCYAHRMVGWNADLAACSAGLKIGILDTGVDRGHPALRGQQVDVVSFAPALTQPSGTQHGTAVTALIAGNGTQGVPGLLPKASIFVADVFHTDRAGRAAADAVSLIRGLDWLRRNNVAVVNVSLAGSANRLLETSIRQLLDSGMIMIAAAGNDGPKAPPRYPAAIPGVVAVTAIDEQRRIYRSAATGTHIGFAAPGVNVWTAQPSGRYGAATGTSYAAPFVTAVIATVARLGKLRGDAIPVIDLGAPGPDPVFGKGLIQAPQTCTLETSRN